MKSTVYVVLLISLIGCESMSDVPRAEKLKLYNDALDQIITDNYFQHCLIFDEKTEKIQNDFYQGKTDSLTYFKSGDSLKAMRKNMLPKCILDYSNYFHIFTTDHNLTVDFRESISEILKDSFLIENFANTSAKAIMDTLSRTAQIIADDLKVGYLKIIPYVKSPKRPYGEGMGVMAFSRIYFNSEADKAILFCEFNCGPTCGTGKAVFLVKGNNMWKVKKYIDVWHS